MNFFKEHIIYLISKNTELKRKDLENIIEVPPDKLLGDYSLPCFDLAKKLKKSPMQISEEIRNKLPKSKYLKKTETKKGYLNFFIEEKELAEITLKNILKDRHRYGSANLGKKKLVMVEYSSPNTNKPLHLGYIRNNLIGMSLSNILGFLNYKVIRTSVVNDKGVHICKSMLAYSKWGNNKKPNKKPDHFVGDFYVLFSQKEKEDPSLNEQAQNMLALWEKKDKKTLDLWKKMNSWVYKGFQETYDILGSKFDKVYYESQIYEKGKNTVINAYKKNIFKEEDSAIMADLSSLKLPNKVLIRSDKTSLYITQDIYLAILKFKEYDLERSIYVVANEQGLHFKQLFAILSLLKFKHYKDCYHLSYGYVLLPTGKMKSREGAIVDADNLIREMVSLAKLELQKRHKLKEKELDERSFKIALGAIKFFFLKYETFKDIVFNPEESISFEGETGPYIQYTYARANSILRKAKKLPKKFNSSLLNTPEEIDLLNILYKFPDYVEESAKNYKMSVIAHYLILLAQKFNEFYQKHQVINSSIEIKNARLILVVSCRQVLWNAAKLLNIDMLEEM